MILEGPHSWTNFPLSQGGWESWKKSQSYVPGRQSRKGGELCQEQKGKSGGMPRPSLGSRVPLQGKRPENIVNGVLPARQPLQQGHLPPQAMAKILTIFCGFPEIS